MDIELDFVDDASEAKNHTQKHESQPIRPELPDRAANIVNVRIKYTLGKREKN